MVRRCMAPERRGDRRVLRDAVRIDKLEAAPVFYKDTNLRPKGHDRAEVGAEALGLEGLPGLLGRRGAALRLQKVVQDIHWVYIPPARHKSTRDEVRSAGRELQHRLQAGGAATPRRWAFMLRVVRGGQ